MIDPRELGPMDIRAAAAQLRGGQLMRFVDSTHLLPDATPEQVRRHVDEAAALGAHACISPAYLADSRSRLDAAADRLEKTNLLSTVVGFPLGAVPTATKVAEAQLYLSQGADELDMVANTGLLKAGDVQGYRRDIDAVAEAVAAFNSARGSQAALKVIIECCLLNENEKVAAAEAVARCGRERAVPVMVKTSTGLARPPEGVPPGATIGDALLIGRTIGPFDKENNFVGIKAAGGIRDATRAVRLLIAAGAYDDDLKLQRQTYHAVRLGASVAAAIARDFDEIYSGH